MEVAAAALDFTPTGCRPVEVAAATLDFNERSDLMSQSSADLAAPPSPIAQSQVSSRHPLSTDLVVTVTAPTVISHSLIFLFH